MCENFDLNYYKNRVEKLDNDKRVIFDMAARDVCTIIMKEIIHEYPIFDKKTPECVKTTWELINNLDNIFGITR